MSLSESIVVGIYGIQGVGKSYVLKQCAKKRIEWNFVDGSQLIKEALHDKGKTLQDFQHLMTASEKADVRKAAIERAKRKPGLTLISGHCSFPSSNEVGSDGSIQFIDVFTEADGSVYDLIIYLEKHIMIKIGCDHCIPRTSFKIGFSMKRQCSRLDALSITSIFMYSALMKLGIT